METNNKYYIPEIEEFHVGFEYEYNNNGNWIEVKMPWLVKDFDLKDTRVKYLDKSDIESSGFILGKYDSQSFSLFLSDKIIITKEIRLYQCGTKIIIHEIDNGKQLNLYSGIIKNKSELSFILKRLGITD
jgi:hypothetical protein